MTGSRVVLIHWHVDEAQARAEELRRAGFCVDVHSDERADPRLLRKDPPDVFLIDLGRAPSHGREVGGWLRRQSATRRVPLVFVEGEPEKTAQVCGLLPDAVFTTWDEAARALEVAIVMCPSDPVVPGTMDAYAGRPLPKKLGIREGSIVGLLRAPDGFEDLLGELPAGARTLRVPESEPDILLLFAPALAGIEEDFATAADALADGGKLWLCWPKKASGIQSDLSERVVRAFGLERGWVDYKICSIDATWSGLCFARRRK